MNTATPGFEIEPSPSLVALCAASVDLTTAPASASSLAAEIIELAEAIRTLAGMEAQNYSNHIEARRDFAAIWGRAGRIAANADKLSRS